MSDTKEQRKIEDRRVDQIKLKGKKKDKRDSVRRKEDREDVKTYYYVLGFISTIIAIFGIVSYIYG